MPTPLPDGGLIAGDDSTGAGGQRPGTDPVWLAHANCDSDWRNGYRDFDAKSKVPDHLLESGRRHAPASATT